LSGAEPTAEALAQLPPAAARPVDFRREVQPILEASCVKCHGRGKAKGDWKLDTRDAFLQPGESGPAVVVGDSAKSHFIHLVAGTDPDSVMPQKGTKLSREQVGVLRAWVDQGMKWDPQVTFAQPAPNNLQPRRPELPAGKAAQPVDRLADAYFKQHQVKPAKPVDDRLFARRVYLDVVGLLPAPAELDAFLKDRSSDKRERLVRQLLADSPRYAQHWLSFWNDLLRNDYKGTGYIDGGRKQISQWLYAALRDNKPYDQFVRELVNPTEASEGFTKGIVWRGTVNASMTPPMQAAQNIGQVLMGVNLKCASCHDSFIDDWQLGDAYGLAGIYAEDALEMVLCDKPTGKVAPLKFLFPELGAVDPKAPKTNRLEQLAQIITRRENGRLSRTLVNRLWAKLLGRGLVEPLDVMQNEAWSPDLLDWLAEDLVAHQWNLKRTLELILTSRAYQLPSVNLADKPEPTFTFTGPAVRRFSAEQFRDALGSLTGVWQDKPEGGLDRLLLDRVAGKAPAAEAFWVWGDAHGASGVPPGTNGFRKVVVLDAIPSEATLIIHADNSARIFVNGQRVRGSDAPDWSQPSVYDARSLFHAGTNVIAVEAVNGGDGANPAGVLVYAKLRRSTGGQERVLDFATDASWQARAQPTGKWRELGFTEGWPAAAVLGGPSLAPWNVAEALASAVAGKTVYGSVRASLTSADPLALALGRPNREQVTTVRQSTATTIQALELTNGDTLAQLLKRGAAQLVATHADGRTLAEHVFRQALSRPPTRRELNLAVDLVGRKPQAEGVEDLLWSVAMLPEFQLTY
jgi:mono/diheme cytochrome c family protein